MNTPAHILISAIQTCEPAKVAEAIEQAQTAARIKWDELPHDVQRGLMPNPVNAAMPGMAGLTALHVAARAYAAHEHDPKLAAAFNAMVQLLLDAGANPWLAVGAKVGDPGQTVAQVCQGKQPPALKGWLSHYIDDRNWLEMDESGDSRAPGARELKVGHEWLQLHSTTRARLKREAQKRREQLTDKQIENGRKGRRTLAELTDKRRRFSQPSYA